MRSLSFFICIGLLTYAAMAQSAKTGLTIKKTSAKSTSSTARKPKNDLPKTVSKPVNRSSASSVQPGKRAQPARKKTTAANKPAATKSALRPVTKSVKKTSVADDKTEFEKASALADPAEKINALKKFVDRFPNSALLAEARASLSTTASSVADEKLAAGDVSNAIALYKLAVGSVPTPVPAQLFTDSLIKIPTVLFWRGERAEALEIAKTLESKIGPDAEQLSNLAMYYVTIENGDEAVRVAEAAVKAGPTKSKPYATLGLAQRVNFRLDESAAAYAKAVELEPTSAALKRSLAEIKRATGKSEDAVAIYRELVTADATDQQSRNGLVLSLFDTEKTEDAEKELATALEQNPENVMLMAGVAYWYAAHKNSDKAIEYGRRAIAAEPRYVWSYIALGRGLMQQNRALEAEETLLKARQYGKFPTLDYEIASARYMAGFYRDAVEGLQKNFSITDDSVVTKIGDRVERKGASFTEIINDERRASILEPAAADDAETAERLKALLALWASVSKKSDAASVEKAADAFVVGDDKYKFHRELYTASLLLNNKIAPAKALEYAQSAVGNADAALDLPNASALVMAGELYESRQVAFSRNELLKVPDVPRPLLTAIFRGRIEDAIGWALLQQEKPAEAAVHFRRAVGILPEKSAWWRAGMWRLGTALQSEGKEAEALDAYIKSYAIDKPDISHYTTVEALYKKLNGSTEGLEAKIGRSPIAQVSPDAVAKNDEPQIPPVGIAATTSALRRPAPTPNPNLPIATPTPTPTVEAAPTPLAEPVQSPTPVATPAPAPDPSPVAESTPIPTPEPIPTPSPTPEPKATPEATPAPAVEQVAKVEATPTVAPSPTPEALPTQTPIVDATPTPTPTPVAEPSPTPTPQPVVVSTPEATPIPTPETKAEPTTAAPILTPTPTPAATPDEKIVAETTNKPVPERPQRSTSSSPKPLFEPIIIVIPKFEVPKASTSFQKPEQVADADRSKQPDDRPRLVEGRPVKEDIPPPCQILVTQEKLSLVNDGGLQSLLVGVDRPELLANVKFEISDPDDISVRLETDVGGIEGRSLFVIKSTSERTGTFRVTFYLPCGKKEVTVTVR